MLTLVSSLTGYLENEVLGKHPSILWSDISPEQIIEPELMLSNSLIHFQTQRPNKRKNGTLFYVDQSVAHIRDDSSNVSHYVSFSKDSTDRLLKEHTLKDLASKDPLTELLNRRAGEH